jgi:cobalt-zinc-cadmium efflux system outer membrane protein
MKRHALRLKIESLSGLLLTGVLLIASPLHAEGLDQLVNEALSSNPDLAAARSRWQQFTYQAPQVGSLQDPELSFTFSSYPNDTLASDETPMTGNELRLAQKFPFPGKLAGRADLSREQARWFEAVYRDQHYLVARKVKDAWYRLNFNQQAIKVTERNLALVDDIVRLAEVRYETGSGLQQDVLKAQVKRSQFMERLMSLRQQQAVIQAELNRLTNRTSHVTFELPGDLDLVKTDKSLEDFKQAAAEQRPMNDAYQSLIRRYGYQGQLADLDDYPDVTLFASWRYRDNNLPDGGTDFISAGVSINLPIYRDKRRAAKAEAREAEHMAERQAQEFRNSVVESIQNAYARMEETRQQADLYRMGIIPQTSQSFHSALSSYQVGKLEFISLLDALMSTYQAEMDYYRISADYMRSLAWLEAESTLPLIGPPLHIDARQSAGNIN